MSRSCNEKPRQNSSNKQQMEHIFQQLLSDVTEDMTYMQAEFDRYFPSTTEQRHGHFSQQTDSTLPEIANIFSAENGVNQNPTISMEESKYKQPTSNLSPVLPSSQSNASISHVAACSQSPDHQMDEPCSDGGIWKIDPQSPTCSIESSSSSSETDSPNSPNSKAQSRPQRNTEKYRSGRRTNRRKKGKLWEFLLELLTSDETNPSIIRWEDKSMGVFRILDCKRVACLWGIKKSNPSMTYEKLSRALRYYYELDIMLKIEGHKLLYQFRNLSEA